MSGRCCFRFRCRHCVGLPLPVAGIGNRDTGQIAVGMRNCYWYFPDSYMRAGMPACWPEFRWHR